MTASTLAAKLAQAHRERELIEDLESDDIPADANAAYAIQEEVLTLTHARIGAWKVGARAPGAQANGAAIDAARVHESPARLAHHQFFRVPPRDEPYTRTEVFAALGGMAVALEIVDSRFAQWPNLAPLAQLADAQNNGALIVGKMEPYEVVSQGFDFLTPRLDLNLDGVSILPAATGNPAGDPRELLVWFVNHCRTRGHGVQPSWIVTTGSYTGAHRVEQAGVISGRIDRIGEIELALQ
jgi:2-keto-4-pentenoate hydratase